MRIALLLTLTLIAGPASAASLEHCNGADIGYGPDCNVSAGISALQAEPFVGQVVPFRTFMDFDDVPPDTCGIVFKLRYDTDLLDVAPLGCKLDRNSTITDFRCMVDDVAGELSAEIGLSDSQIIAHQITSLAEVEIQWTVDPAATESDIAQIWISGQALLTAGPCAGSFISTPRAWMDIVVTGPDDQDVDNDGTPDKDDNCLLVSNIDQADSNGDGFGTRCDGDYNGDLVVGQPDFTFFLNHLFGTTNPDGDHNEDGAVGIPDLSYFQRYFGQAAGPAGCGPFGC